MIVARAEFRLSKFALRVVESGDLNINLESRIMDSRSKVKGGMRGL